jgi:alpha-L-rhamnosidase
VSFLHRYVAGIRLPGDGAPAYRRFRIEPRPGGGITWAQARHDSPYGPIESEWRLAGGDLELTVVVPPGTMADVVLPDGAHREFAAGRHAITGAAAA